MFEEVTDTRAVYHRRKYILATEYCKELMYAMHLIEQMLCQSVMIHKLITKQLSFKTVILKLQGRANLHGFARPMMEQVTIIWMVTPEGTTDQ